MTAALAPWRKSAAITRAKDELYLTYPLIWHQARDGDIMQKPSRFIAELPKELYELWKIKAW